MKLTVASLFAFSIATLAHAQSYNVDVGPASGFGPPARAYGAAAGQTGFWNEIGPVGVLTDVSGNGSMVKIVSGGTGMSFVALDNPATGGDDEKLLDDGVRLVGAQAVYTLHIATLSPGAYLVYVYAIAPDSSAISTVEVSPSSTPIQTCGGVFPGAHVEGVSYTRHVVELSSCCLIVRIRPQADQGFFAGLQIVRLADAVLPSCAGTPDSCPCANGGAGGAGCANSANAFGGKLAASGAQVVGWDSFVLGASQVPATATVLFFEGSTSVAPVFTGDGLRCAGGNLIRLGASSAVGGSASWPGALDPAISAATSVLPGEQRVYQAWYRDPAAFCTGATFNLTNALAATWY